MIPWTFAQLVWHQEAVLITGYLENYREKTKIFFVDIDSSSSTKWCRYFGRYLLCGYFEERILSLWFLLLNKEMVERKTLFMIVTNRVLWRPHKTMFSFISSFFFLHQFRLFGNIETDSIKSRTRQCFLLSLSSFCTNTACLEIYQKPRKKSRFSKQCDPKFTHFIIGTLIWKSDSLPGQTLMPIWKYKYGRILWDWGFNDPVCAELLKWKKTLLNWNYEFW